MAEPAQQLDLFSNPGVGSDQTASTPAHWPVRQSRKAKHLRINVHPDGRVEVVAPMRATPADVASFVREHRDWVKRQLARIKPVQLSRPTQLALRAVDEQVAIDYRVSPSAQWQHTEQIVHVEGAESAHRSVLSDWLKGYARYALTERVEQWAQRTELDYERLQWRLQKTRWGSCSSNRTISLNAAILLLPSALADCVIVHELCHLRYMSHGPRFWGLLSRHLQQDAKALDRQINRFKLPEVSWLLGTG